MCIIYSITIIIYCMLAIILHTLLYIKKEQKQTGKGKSANGTAERGTGQRMPPPSSPVPRLPSVPSAVLTVRTIASSLPPHPIAPSGRNGRAPCPPLGDVIAATSPPIAQQQTEGQGFGLPVILPASSPPSGGGVGQTTSQGRGSPPAHPADPLHPAGEDRQRPASHFWRFWAHIPPTRTN